MNTLKRRLCRAMIGAIVGLVPLASGSAWAAGTDAGSTVSNTFTLDYEVSGTAQTQITPGAPTTFTVDRIVDLTVTSQGDVTVNPNATGQQLIYSVRNDGNDNQAYSLAVEDASGDDFDATLAAAATVYVDDGDGIFEPGADDGAGTAYTLGGGSASADISPDEILWVVVSGDIPSASDGQSDGVILVANTLNPVTSIEAGFTGTAGVATAAETGANNIDGLAQNVLADAAGVATADGANDGVGSDQANFNISAADLSAAKTVSVIDTDASAIDCANDAASAGNQYAVPGACIEYVITVSNDAGASSTATAIAVSDTLPDEVDFVGATRAGFSVLGSLSTPTVGCTTSCVVSLSGASLDPGDTGTVTIRATVR